MTVDVILNAPSRLQLAKWLASLPMPLARQTDDGWETRPWVFLSPWPTGGRFPRTATDGIPATYFAGVAYLMRLGGPVGAEDTRIPAEGEDETDDLIRSKLARYVRNNGTRNTYTNSEGVEVPYWSLSLTAEDGTTQTVNLLRPSAAKQHLESLGLVWHTFL